MFVLDGAWATRHGGPPDEVVRWSEGDPGDPFELLADRLAVGDFSLAVGYLGYDLGRQIERIPPWARRMLDLPDLWVGLWAEITEGLPLRSPGALQASGPPRGSLPRADYLSAVAELRSRLAAGDLYQANLTQRITVPVAPGGDAHALFGTLMENRPEALGCYLDCGQFQVVSASPERFLRFDPTTRRLQTEPIKGTVARGRLPELLHSAKDRAEHVMIVDLERNDLGRVCEPGSVGVDGMMRPMDLPTVHHLVTTVAGTARPEAGLAEILRATFPGGSVTGAPKVAAMRAIEELEPVRRGVYCGAVGWFGPDGGFDLNLAIRTAVVQGGGLHIHAGGGVVIDSTPQGEYEECWLKARAFLDAVGAAPGAGYSGSVGRSALQLPPPS